MALRRHGWILGSVNVLVSGLIVVVAAALAITAILLVRRRAPEGSYFNDGDRAAGVFGVLATGFALLLGLVVVLAFTSYDNSRTGAESEALTLAQQFEVSHLLPDAPGQQLAGQLICYGRSVVHEEWPRMERGEQSDAMNPWGVATFKDDADRGAAHGGRAGGLREVAGPAPRPRVGARDQDPRRGRRDPGAAVARALRHGRA